MPVTLIATGGTIASTRGEDGHVTATLTASDLLALAGEPQPDVELVDLSVPGSWNLSTDQLAAVGREAATALERGSDGVVITHGTDVMEETAMMCDLLLGEVASSGPVVLTGAMRHASEFSGDGPRNLADALAAASEPSLRGVGAVVCMNGEIHHARWVTKTHATALATFSSPGRGPLGEVSERGVRLLSPVPPRPPDCGGEVVSDVAVVVSHADVDQNLIAWHLDRGVRGLVVQGGGAGNVNRNLLAGIERALADDVPVVVSTRCLSGEVTPIYGGAGGFAALHDMGVIPSAGLSTGKARVGLAVALGADPSPVAVRSWFRALHSTNEIGP